MSGTQARGEVTARREPSGRTASVQGANEKLGEAIALLGSLSRTLFDIAEDLSAVGLDRVARRLAGAAKDAAYLNTLTSEAAGEMVSAYVRGTGEANTNTVLGIIGALNSKESTP